jgi:beta-galactosidase
VQSGKSAGTVTLEATSAGLASARAAITTKAVKLRPQVSAWDRAVPAGEGVTGLWRPKAALAAAQTGNPMALAGGSIDMIFTLRQEGGTITGEVEASGGGGFFGGSPGGAIEEGRIDGSKISFRAGSTTYTGVVSGDAMELQRSAPQRRRPGAGAPPAGLRPAVGPPPDGTDPSFGAGFGRGGGAPAPLVLRRVSR